MFDSKFAINSFPKILSVVPTTIVLSAVATVIGLVLAILMVIIRERKIKVLDSIVAVYVSFIRGTPIIVQLYVVYYGLPQLILAIRGMSFNTTSNGLPTMLIAVLAYSLNASANISESIRSAYHSVDYQQYEAAVTVGMRPARAMTRIVIPQLITNFITNFSNLFLDLVKDTAIVYNIGIVEIMAKANILSSLGFKYIETYLDALIIYVSICWIFAKLFYVIEVITRKSVTHDFI